MIETIQAALKAAAKSMIEEVVKKIHDRISDKVEEKAFYFHHKVFLEPQITENSIKSHIREMKHWCEYIHHHGMLKSAGLDSVFVSMRLNSDPKKFRMGHTDYRKLYKASEIIDSRSNIVLIGDMGAGKTTLLKKYALKVWSEKKQKKLIIFRFRDFQPGETIFSRLCNLIKIDFGRADITKKESEGLTFEDFSLIKKRALAEFCNKFKLTILLDGLDEAPFEDKSLLGVLCLKDQFFRNSS